MTGRIIDGSRGLTGKPRLTLEINEDEAFETAFDELHEKDKITIELKPYREKRSRDANAYFWKLCGDLAAKLRIPKEDIYREYVREIGGNYYTTCLKEDEVQAACDCWARNGIGWIYDILPSKLNGCKIALLYYGSSEYDTAQMSRLIDMVVYDCKEQGIETATPDEIANMKSLWEEHEKHTAKR